MSHDPLSRAATAGAPLRAVPALPPPVVTRLVPRRGPGAEGVQGSLALDLEVRAAPAPVPTVSSRTPDVADRSLRSWSTRFAQALVEVVGGHRPVTQLAPYTSREVYRDVERRTRLVQQAATPEDGALPLRSTVLAQVRSVHVSRPAAAVAEVAVHVSQGHRSRALALRLERRRERWVCTALELS